LNFGHTIGHAVESYSLIHDQSPLRHGEAIAIGMICESYISNSKSGLTAADLKIISDRIYTTYSSYQLNDSTYHELIELMKNDKKNEGSAINLTLLSKIGEANYNQEVDVELILESLNYYNSLKRD
jgi:3-dehydroquinate synthase